MSQRDCGSGYHDEWFNEVSVDSVEAPIAEDPLREIDRLIAHDRISAALETLTHRQHFAVERLWGLNGSEPHSVLEVAEAMGVTRAAVQDLERKAFARMRGALGTRG